jgi:hypothetical protein
VLRGNETDYNTSCTSQETDYSATANSHETDYSLQETDYSENTLKVSTLNVCGLKRRVHYPEFLSIVKSYNIFGVAETKLDEYDMPSIDGNEFISKPRKQKYLSMLCGSN